MKFTKILLAAALNVAILSACSSSDDDDNGAENILLEGMNITLRNTLEEGGSEGSFPGLFGQADDAFDESGTLSFSESEFPTALAQPGAAGGTSGLYDIDLNADSISYTLLPAALIHIVSQRPADVFSFSERQVFMNRSFGHTAGGSDTFIAEVCFVLEAQGLDEFFHWNPDGRHAAFL